jgi:hypothetical protein
MRSRAGEFCVGGSGNSSYLHLRIARFRLRFAVGRPPRTSSNQCQREKAWKSRRRGATQFLRWLQRFREIAAGITAFRTATMMFYGSFSATGTATGRPHLRAVASGSIAELFLRSSAVSISLPSPRCPACRSGCVRRSRRKGMLERTLLTVAFVRPFRCVECGWRFLRPSLRESFETRQAVFASRMVPKKVVQPEVKRRLRNRTELDLNLS